MNLDQTLFLEVRASLRTLDIALMSRIIKDYPISDVSDMVCALISNKLTEVQFFQLFPQLPNKQKGLLFSALSERVQDTLLAHLSIKATSELFEYFPADFRVDVYKRLSVNHQNKLLPLISQSLRDEMLNLSTYPEGTVGAATNSDYITLNPNVTVQEALKTIKQQAENMEMVYITYVIDENKKLLGTVSLKDMVLNEPLSTMADIMKKNPIFARAEWPHDQAVKIIRRYRFLAIPVIDNNNAMMGIVTIDDALDISSEEVMSSLTQFGGNTPSSSLGLDIVQSSFQSLFLNRLFWLFILTFLGIIASFYVASQENILKEMIILAAFIAPVVSMGGNTACQSATLVMKNISMGKLTLNWQGVFLSIKKELPIAFSLGAFIALLEILLLYYGPEALIMHPSIVLTIIGSSLLVCISVGGLFGAMLPFLAKKSGKLSGFLNVPVITSIMDLLGVLIYFGLAYLCLTPILAL